MTKIPRQPVRMPESDGAARVMQLLAELSAADAAPALSPALALVLTVAADGGVDITTNVHPGQVVALLRTIAMQVIGDSGINGGDRRLAYVPGEELYRYANAVGLGELPPLVVTCDVVPDPQFTWVVPS